MAILLKNEYSEVYIILTKLNLFDQLPIKVQEMIANNKIDDYIFDFNEDIPLYEQVDNTETLALLSYIYVKYLCNDESEKRYLISKYQENEIEYQKELKEKFNPDNLFKNRKSKETEQNLSIIVPKKSIFRKILDKFKSMLKK